MIDWKEVRLRTIRDQAKFARQYFSNHSATASEIVDRHHLDEIEFLLSVIDERRQG